MLLWLAAGPSEQLGWIARPSPIGFLHVADNIVGGGVVAVVLFALVLGAAVQWRRSFAQTGRSRAVWADGLGLLWLVLPFVLAAVVSTAVKPILLDRYMIVCVPAVALVAASTVARLRLRLVAVGALSVVVIGSLVTIERGYGGQRTDWRDAVDYFSATALPTDGVVVCPARARLPVTYYMVRTVPADLRPIPLSPSDPWTAGFRVKGVGEVTAAGWMSRGPDRIWVLGKRQRCGFTFPGREHTVSVAFTGMVVERYDRR
jgi:hypothetical protein